MNVDIFCARLEKQLARLDTREARLQAFIEAVCDAFHTDSHEVALFSVGTHFDQQVLNFIWPPHLASAASSYVPFSSSTSLAVRTFVENRPFINLLFSSTPHASYYEILPIDRETRDRPPPIQKIISVPLRAREGTENGFQGVIQVSHKGATPEEAGEDFVRDDIDLLARIGLLISQYL